MKALEHTRYILDLLSDTAEQLAQYADDAWLAIDRSSAQSMRDGTEQQIEFFEAQQEFSA